MYNGQAIVDIVSKITYKSSFDIMVDPMYDDNGNVTIRALYTEYDGAENKRQFGDDKKIHPGMIRNEDQVIYMVKQLLYDLERFVCNEWFRYNGQPFEKFE